MRHFIAGVAAFTALALAACSSAGDSDGGAREAQPWAGRADVDDAAVADALLAALDPLQRSCIDEEVGHDRLLAAVSSNLDQVANLEARLSDDRDRIAVCLGHSPEESMAGELLAAVAAVLPTVPPSVAIPSEQIPATREGAAAWMRRVAAEEGGRYADEGPRLRVTVQDSGLVTQAFDHAANPRWPLADQQIALFALSADWEVLEAARDGDVLWVRWTTTGDGQAFEVFQWGMSGSTWTFSVLGEGRSAVDTGLANMLKAH